MDKGSHHAEHLYGMRQSTHISAPYLLATCCHGSNCQCVVVAHNNNGVCGCMQSSPIAPVLMQRRQPPTAASTLTDHLLPTRLQPMYPCLYSCTFHPQRTHLWHFHQIVGRQAQQQQHCRQAVHECHHSRRFDSQQHTLLQAAHWGTSPDQQASKQVQCSIVLTVACMRDAVCNGHILWTKTLHAKSVQNWHAIMQGIHDMRCTRCCVPLLTTCSTQVLTEHYNDTLECHKHSCYI